MAAFRRRFEIITLTAWVPHESQQKPLAPGSAKMRLADALGVPERATGDKAERQLKRSRSQGISGKSAGGIGY